MISPESPNPTTSVAHAIGPATSLKQARQALIANTDLRGIDFCHAYADAADSWLSGLLDVATGGDLSKVALIAVGGYGRGELCPGSDLDVAFVHHPRLRNVKKIADAVWYPVWDQGVHLDHSVRTSKEVLAMAKEDLKVMLGLLDGRLIAGNAELAEQVISKAKDLWRTNAASMIPSLSDAVRRRHEARGDVAFLLEPDLKEDRGGLRDLHALHSIAMSLPVIADPSESVDLIDANNTLLEVRVELHRRTGKETDQLLLQEQDPVAEALGIADADELMARVATAGRAIAWAGDYSWRRVDSWLAGPRNRAGGEDRSMGRGLVLKDGEIHLDADASPKNDPAVAVRAAATAAELGTVMSRACLHRLAEEITDPGDPWPKPLLDGLIALLGMGRGAISALEALDQIGVLTTLIPEWAAVRNRPQRNALHRFTVDRHLCEAAANASALVREVSRPDLLLMGAWLHDLGKGFPGDHTEAGIEVVDTLTRRMGFSDSDVGVIVDMVRYHLTLADTAMKRDLDDPATIDAVANAIRSAELLHILAALTQADSIATNATMWNPWKARLVGDLVDRVSKRLSGISETEASALTATNLGAPGPDPAAPQAADPEMEKLVAEASAQSSPVIRHGELDGGYGWEVRVAAPDRPGLLAAVAGILALHGLEVRSAQATPGTTDIATEVFTVTPLFEREPDWKRMESDLSDALDGKLDVGAKLDERTLHYAGQRRPGASLPAEPKVIVDNDASARATVIEVRAPDGLGVYKITSALLECSLDVAQARVMTLGHEIVDNFYVRDASGDKIEDDKRLRHIEETILSGLEI